MILNSLEFTLFFVAVMAATRLSGKYARFLILLANYLFYASWNIGYLPLIFMTTVVDYFAARKMEGEQRLRRRKLFLWLSLGFNLSVLVYFKYAFQLINSAGAWLGLETVFPVPLIPIGLSFHTFQSMGYILDVYRRKVPVERNFIDYANFVSFFPQLIAGPIERASHLLPQLKQPHLFRPKKEDLGKAIYLIFLGLFMTLALSENLALFAPTFYDLTFNGVLEAGYSARQIDYLISIYAFTFTLYLRFAGYSYLAKGYALLLGIDLTTNFKYPFFSRSMAEFWGRWHISLSKWIRDYIFFPLSRRARSEADLYGYIFVTMWLFGLWHQASIGWILASTILASYSVLGHVLRRLWPARRGASLPRDILGMVVTFHVFVFAMIFVNNLAYDYSLADFSRGLVHFFYLDFIAPASNLQLYALQLMGVALLIDGINFAHKDIYGILQLKLPFRIAMISFMLLFLFFTLNPEGELSLYFRM